MKKLMMFFIGLILILLTFMALYFSGLLFDSVGNRNIEAFVFQPNNISSERVGRPQTVDQVSDKFIRERLIKKFVVEYFYVTPDIENMANRTRRNSVLAALSAPDVFKNWATFEVPEMEKLAGKKVLRTVHVANEILAPQEGDYYWTVRYDLKTWYEPNNMDLEPVITSGTLYLKIAFEKGVREQRGGQTFDVQKYLDEGGDPAAIFKFRVDEVRK